MTDEIATLRATAHPLRLRIVSLLIAAEMSAADVARELGISHANASYHLRILHDAGMIEVAGEEKIRGGVAKRFRHPHERREFRPGDPDLMGHLRAMAQEMVRRHLRGSSRPRTYADAELWLPPETWEEVVRALQQAAALMHDHARPPRTPGTIKASLTFAAFKMDDE